MRKTYLAIVASGASSFISFKDLLAADRQRRQGKPTLLWLHGTSCSGCSISFLNVEDVPVPDVLMRFVNLAFHPDLSLATGHQVIELLDKLIASGERPYLVFEGGVPTDMPHTCVVGGRPISSWLEEILPRTSGVIAAGTCATFGGVAAMPTAPTQSKSLVQFVKEKGFESPIVSLPGCPMRPEHFIYTVLHFARHGAPPPLDATYRPRYFFEDTVHDHCIYYGDFQENRFARFIGDDGCLLRLGCQGPVTHSDCVVRGHNGNTNTCIKAGHPCIGCASEHFPRTILLRRWDAKGGPT